MLEVVRQDDACRVIIRGDMTIYQARELFDALNPLLAIDQPLTLDLAEVTNLDTSGAQLLMLARKVRDAKGLPLTLEHHSEAVSKVFDCLGLTAWFQNPLPTSATGTSATGTAP